MLSGLHGQETCMEEGNDLTKITHRLGAVNKINKGAKRDQ
jgi:hypothetical protein